MKLPDGYTADSQAAFAQLKTRKRLSIDDLKVLAMLECFGEEFYLGLARQLPNAAASALLSRNGNEERGHAHRLLKAIRLLGGESFELPAAANNPFMQGPATPITVTADLLAAFAQGEVDGDLAYQAWADAEPNAEVAKLYRQNGAEETQHAQRLSQVRALLQAST
jgi:rubrerythrin